MNKNILAIMIGLLLAGCANQAQEPKSSEVILPIEWTTALANQEQWQTYTDPMGRFQFSYPEDWSQTESTTEIQFWDNLNDGANSVKVSLFEETRTLEEITQFSEEDETTQTEEAFEATTVNEIPALIRTGSNAWGNSQTYYYQLDEELIGLIAIFLDDDEAIRSQVERIQNSFQVLNDF